MARAAGGRRRRRSPGDRRWLPTSDLAGWATVLPGTWAALLCAPLALLALGSAVSPRWRAGITLLVVALSGLATAFLAVGVSVASAGATAVPLWPGTGLSLAWIGVVGAATITLDTALTLPRLRVAATGLAALALVVCAVPALTAFHGDRSALTNGPESTLPAYVRAQAAGDRPISTLILTPQNDGGLAVEVVRGASETLGAQTTMLSTAVEPQGTDLAVLAVDLISARDFDAPAQLLAQGISYVLLAEVPGEGDRARTLRTASVAAIDQRAGLVQAGSTDRGVLWRLEGEPAEPAALSATQEGTARVVVTLQLLVVLAALLLSIPTRASRRAARAQSRIVGRAPEEPLVLPRHAEDSVPDAAVVPPVGTVEDPQDEPALADEALAPIADAEPADDGADPARRRTARRTSRMSRPPTTREAPAPRRTTDDGHSRVPRRCDQRTGRHRRRGRRRLCAGRRDRRARPWPTVTHEPAQERVTPLPGDSVLVCAGDFRALGRNTAAPSEMRRAATPELTAGGTNGVPSQTGLAVPDLVDGQEVPVLTGAVEGRSAPLIAGAESSTLAAEDLAGFAASPCGVPRLESWLVGGSVGTGAEDVVLLANTADVPATVTLAVYGTARGGRTVIVPPRTQTALPLTSIAAGNDVPVVKVSAVGAPVRAVLQSALMQVLDPVGADQQEAVSGPQQHVVLPGVQAFAAAGDQGDMTVLRLLAPGADALAEVRVTAEGVVPVWTRSRCRSPPTSPRRSRSAVSSRGPTPWRSRPMPPSSPGCGSRTASERTPISRGSPRTGDRRGGRLRRAVRSVPAAAAGQHVR